MIVTLNKPWQSELLLLPARNNAGELRGLEILTNFVGVGADVRIPTELVAPHLTEEEELTLFKEKLDLLDSCKLFFVQHQLIAWINITPAIGEFLLSNGNAAAILDRYPFLEFTVNENYPGLINGKDDLTLARMAIHFPMVLADYGAGAASNKAVFDGLFTRVALDKGFIQQRVVEFSFEPFMRAILAQISPYCQSVMVAGVDDEEVLRRMMPFIFSAMQGNLWSAVTAEQVTTLVQ
ncbi:EAL domain-containing protein [Lelliottia sp. V106_10]|uniref:EAL domain-containing protein n=1 Tax=Lelliottia wanjuensis TaxID=3050585 RepID=UPI00254BA502|nr:MULTISPECIES: EAL domain-containing protein [unclassified Lelliottia]MDK9357344.1 EAL domain-containing protein [Lelliottia sp. V106_16]MDK9373163.1 EAL domain-containing protein [Lelliottia sp. V106_10]MDK9599967.1 EAL domain-containing protein [Lelliottia sp. V106_5]